MDKDISTLPGLIHESAGHAYPGDLARLVRQRWDDTPAALYEPGRAEDATRTAEVMLPDDAVLEKLFSTCYQASLLREEERTVTFRAILAEPTLFNSGEGPPDGLHKLEFPGLRPFDEQELRRLSVAADFHRSLIGVVLDEDSNPRIWGLIHSGTRWLRDTQGGRRGGAPLPPAPVIHIGAPGSVEVHKGYELVGKLELGKLSGSRADLFESELLPAEFSEILEELVELHESTRARARELADERWAPLAPGLERRIAERMLKRVVSVVRDARHGGTVIFVPSENVTELCGENPYIDIKYSFSRGQSRCRFRDLTVRILNRLSRLHSATGGMDPDPVGWEEFETTADGEIAGLDEALFEMAYLISGLAASDGAVVMSKRHELLGFGGEISGGLPEIKTIARALDPEGARIVEEHAEDVGTRHRSAYRLVGALPGALAVVISQDSSVQFVSFRNGRVTYWDQE